MYGTVSHEGGMGSVVEGLLVALRGEDGEPGRLEVTLMLLEYSHAPNMDF